MELRDLARQILFSDTLEDKLISPGTLTDRHPGGPIDAPPAPVRPASLHFKSTGSGPRDFPNPKQLGGERERGRLLHFFANHELLATELMALVLLRFPQAPAAFRQGVARTLQDEQRHTRLYLQRMHECGVQFGDLPVSGYFWRAVSGMENPIDYVARLSLTFEQANLDFTRQFSQAFAAEGDPQTAQLLEGIYRDEIVHVAYGLKWFRRWKNPGQNDWDALCRQLKFPLSPTRAKGPVFNIEGRRAAGFDPGFIQQLAVHAQSKGRTPRVFFFNPLAEGTIALGSRFTPVKHQARLVRDLENLPQFLGRQDDLVLVRQKPSVEFLGRVQAAGFPLPEFIELSGASIDSVLFGRKLRELRPWAWAPDSVELFRPLFSALTKPARPAGDCFNEKIAALYSKSWSAAILARVLPGLAEPWLCGAGEIGCTVTTLPAALEAIAEIRARGHHRIVVKESLGLAGHNALRLWEPELLDTQRRWMARACENQRPLVIEPWLDRQLDFSIQLEMTGAGLTVRGHTGLLADARGQFLGNWAEPNYARRFPVAIGNFFPGQRSFPQRLQNVFSEIYRLLETDLRAAGFLGPLGIDCFVYRDASGSRIKPIVEINPRYTMGRLVLELMNRVHPGSFACFELLNAASLAARGCASFPALAALLESRFPLRLEQGRIRQGLLCLNDPAVAGAVLATFRVADSLEALIPAAGSAHTPTAPPRGQ